MAIESTMTHLRLTGDDARAFNEWLETSAPNDVATDGIKRGSALAKQLASEGKLVVTIRRSRVIDNLVRRRMGTF